MTYAGKPKVVKARIGKIFAKEIGIPGRFEKVERYYCKTVSPKEP